MQKNLVLCAAILVPVMLTGCSSEQSDPNALQIPSSSTSAEQVETERISEVRREINRTADGYDYAAAIKIAEKDPAQEIRDLVPGLKEEQAQAEAWPTPDKIPHLFFHSLIVDPQRAFDGDQRAQGYLDYMVTQREFAAILEELYARDYVLVNPEDFAGPNAQGRMEYRKIMLPPGKQPLVISVDDLSYYEYMQGDGFASRLIIDGDGQVRNEYTESDGQTRVGAYDVPTMIDDFVADHPDFSYRNARGLIAMTGYNGVFGYRTSASQYPQNDHLARDQRTAAGIAAALKDEGWVFASHSWGHLSTGSVSMQRLRRDFDLWNSEVKPIIGATKHLVYPFGSDISGVRPYSGARYNYFKDQGFSYFYGVDGTTRAWEQQGADYQRQMRINVDGLQFAKERAGDRPVLGTFFDVEQVIDPAREHAAEKGEGH